MPLFRQGDVLIRSVELIPPDAKTRSGTVLVRGEATGHSHRFQDMRSAELYESDGKLYLHVTSDFANIVHEEHGTVQLPRGSYLVWQQREYSPKAIRIIRD